MPSHHIINNLSISDINLSSILVDVDSRGGVAVRVSQSGCNSCVRNVQLSSDCSPCVPGPVGSQLLKMYAVIDCIERVFDTFQATDDTIIECAVRFMIVEIIKKLLLPAYFSIKEAASGSTFIV